MPYKKYIITMLMTIIFLFNMIEVNAYGNDEEFIEINRMADEIYRRYHSDIRYLDSLILSSEKNQLNNSLSKAKQRLSEYCTDQIIAKYLDNMKCRYGYKKRKPKCCNSDILIDSKIIYMDANKIIVYQKRREKYAPSQYGGIPQNYDTYKYVFLENDRSWKLKDIVDARSFVASM